MGMHNTPYASGTIVSVTGNLITLSSALTTNDVGRLIILTSGLGILQHRKITAVNGAVITIAHAFNASNLLFINDINPIFGDSYSISNKISELISRDSNLTISGQRDITLNGLLSTSNGVFIHFEKYTFEFNCSNISIAKGSGMIFGYYQYVQGEQGYVTNPCILKDNAVGTGGRTPQWRQSDESFGTLEIYGGITYSSGSPFYRLYQGSIEETANKTTQVRFIDHVIDGNVGMRVAGNKSVLKYTSQNNSSVLGAVNPRASVALVNINVFNSRQCLYIWLAEGSFGKATFPIIKNVTRGLRINGSQYALNNQIYEIIGKFDDINALNPFVFTEYYNYNTNTKVHTVRYGNLVKPNIIDTTNTLITNNIYAVLKDSTGATVNSSIVNDGYYSELFVRHTDIITRNGNRGLNDGTSFAPYKLYLSSHGKKFATQLLSIEDTFDSSIILFDELQFEVDLAVIQNYTELDTTQKIWDYYNNWILNLANLAVIETNPFIPSLDGSTLNTTSNILFNPTAINLMSYDTTTDTFTIKASNITGNFKAPVAKTVTLGSIEITGTIIDANGDSNAIVATPAGFEDSVEIFATRTLAYSDSTTTLATGTAFRYQSSVLGGTDIWFRLRDISEGSFIVLKYRIPIKAGNISISLITTNIENSISALTERVGELTTYVRARGEGFSSSEKNIILKNLGNTEESKLITLKPILVNETMPEYTLNSVIATKSQANGNITINRTSGILTDFVLLFRTISVIIGNGDNSADEYVVLLRNNGSTSQSLEFRVELHRSGVNILAKSIRAVFIEPHSELQEVRFKFHEVDAQEIIDEIQWHIIGLNTSIVIEAEGFFKKELKSENNASILEIQTAITETKAVVDATKVVVDSNNTLLSSNGGSGGGSGVSLAQIEASTVLAKQAQLITVPQIEASTVLAKQAQVVATKTAVDNTKVVIDATKVVVDSNNTLLNGNTGLTLAQIEASSVLAKQAQVVATKTAVDNTKVVVDATKVVVDDTNTVVDATKIVVDSNNTLLNGNTGITLAQIEASTVIAKQAQVVETKTAVDNTKVVVDATKAVVDASDVVIDATKVVVDSNNTLLSSNGGGGGGSGVSLAQIEASTVLAKQAQLVETKTAVDNTKVIVDETKVVADATKVVVDDNNNVADATKVVVDATKRVVDANNTLLSDTTDTGITLTQIESSTVLAKQAQVVANKTAIDGTKVIVDETKVALINARVVVDDIKTETDATKVVVDATKAVVDASDVVIDTTKAVVDANNTLLNNTTDTGISLEQIEASTVLAKQAQVVETKTAIDNTKAVVDTTKAVVDATKVVTDNTKAVVDANNTLLNNTTDTGISLEQIEASTVLAKQAQVVETKTAIDNTKAVVDATKVVVDNTKVVTDNTKVVVDATKVVIDETNTVVDATKVVVDETKVVVDETNTVADTTKVVVDETKVVADETKVVADETKVVADETKVVADETKVIADETKVVADETKVVADATKTNTVNTLAEVLKIDGDE